MPASRRRGVLALLLAGLLMLGGVSPALATTDLAIGSTAVVAGTDGDPVLLRSDAGYQFRVVSHIPEGASVIILAGPIAGDDRNLWYKVDAHGTVGYLFAAFLFPPDAAPQITGAATGEAKVVTGTGGDGLHLRDGADLGAAILTAVPEGATVTLTGAPRLNNGQTWYPVVYRGQNGWLSGEFLGAVSTGAPAVATNQQALAITIGEHVAVSATGGWPLRLRSANNLDAPTITAAPEGAVLQVLDGPLADGAGNLWYAVNYDGLEGYASAAYLSWTDAALTSRAATPVAAAGAVAAGGNVEVSNTGGWPLRLRADSTTAATTVTIAPEGAVLHVIGAPVTDGEGNAWVMVDFDGLQGYASVAYLTATDRSPTERQPTAGAGPAGGAAFAAGAHVEVGNTGGWNLRLRESAGLDGASLAAANEGEVLLVVSGPVADGEGNLWYGVNYDGISGFARASYLSATDRPLSTHPVTAPPVAAPAAPVPAAPAPESAPPPPVAPAPAAPAPPPARGRPVAAAPVRGTGSFIWPAQGTLTQGFGVNVASYGPGGHNGIDIANSAGTPVVAADAGVVTFAGWKGGLGNAVVIDHGNGFVTEYGHASLLVVSVGQQVTRGQQIMAIGSTGRSTGPHVHFSIIRNGVYVNPLGFLSR